LLKPDERVVERACVESDCQKFGNQLFLLRDKPVAITHMLLRAFERASLNHRYAWRSAHSASIAWNGRLIRPRPAGEKKPRARWEGLDAGLIGAAGCGKNAPTKFLNTSVGCSATFGSLN
jgi:hypothetical protein